MTATSMLGAVLGLAVATGGLLVWAGLPFRRRPTLDARLAPYVVPPGWDDRRSRSAAAAAEPAVHLLATPFAVTERILRPYLASGAETLERVLGGGASVRRRLDQSGNPMSVQEFRIDQLVWGAGAFGAAIAASLLMQAVGSDRSVATLVIFCCAAAVAGVVARDQRLSRDVRRREQQMMAEFPAVADLLALAVTAGEGPVAALERVARVSSGELGREIGRALGDARAGVGLVPALDGIAGRTSLAALSRFVDGIAVALERGTPLADLLRSQAADVREARNRHPLEIGGRKEILMMFPVVFMVLPVTILFALYPGLIQISAVVP